MIKLVDCLPETNAQSVALARIKCTFSAYPNYPKIALFWAQTDDEGRVNALLSLMERTLCVYAEGVNEELSLFIKSQDFDFIFADEQIADALFLRGERVCALRFEANGEEEAKEQTNPREIYEIFKNDFKLNELEFIADLSHRIRHGCAFCVRGENAAAVVQRAGKVFLLTGIAVKKEARGKGVGSEILNEIKTKAKGEIFLCCEEKVLPFYLKNSFKQIGFCKIGRI